MLLNNDKLVTTKACFSDQEGIGAVALDIITWGGVHRKSVDKETACAISNQDADQIGRCHGKHMAAGPRVVIRLETNGSRAKAYRYIAGAATCDTGNGSIATNSNLGKGYVGENEAKGEKQAQEFKLFHKRCFTRCKNGV